MAPKAGREPRRWRAWLLEDIEELVGVEQGAGEGEEAVLGEELPGLVEFGRFRGAAVGEEEGLADLFAGREMGEAPFEGAGHVDGEAVVEQGEGLQGGGGRDAAGFGQGGVRTVEDGEEFGGDGAGGFGVDGAAVGFRAELVEGEVGGDVIDGVLIEAEAGAAAFGVEDAGDVEEGVADGFGAEALGWEAPEQAGGGIEAGGGGLKALDCW
jgi:hypothetical protein